MEKNGLKFKEHRESRGGEKKKFIVLMEFSVTEKEKKWKNTIETSVKKSRTCYMDNKRKALVSLCVFKITRGKTQTVFFFFHSLLFNRRVSDRQLIISSHRFLSVRIRFFLKFRSEIFSKIH